MNISGFISGLKQKVRDREDCKAVAVANTLKAMKEKRVRAEGHKRIYDAQAQEKAKTAKARSDLRLMKRESTVIGRMGLAVQKNMKDQAKKKSKKKDNNFGFSNDSPNAWFPKK